MKQVPLVLRICHLVVVARGEQHEEHLAQLECHHLLVVVVQGPGAFPLVDDVPQGRPPRVLMDSNTHAGGADRETGTLRDKHTFSVVLKPSDSDPKRVPEPLKADNGDGFDSSAPKQMSAFILAAGLNTSTG